jgi:hypothetical protein
MYITAGMFNIKKKRINVLFNDSFHCKASKTLVIDKWMNEFTNQS